VKAPELVFSLVVSDNIPGLILFHTYFIQRLQMALANTKRLDFQLVSVGVSFYVTVHSV
jgi:hypothetical protein